MANSLAVVVSLPFLAAGASLFSDSSNTASRVIRREAALMDAHGQLSRDSPSRHDVTKFLMDQASKSKVKLGDWCDYNYVEGVVSTKTCQDPAVERQINEPAMCLVAANATCPDGSCLPSNMSKFVLKDEASMAKYTTGCFKNEDTPPKWYYNPIEVTQASSTVVGTPMCLLVEYINGTAGTNDCGKQEYDNIVNEDDCRSLATCLSYCTHGQFRILDPHEVELAPKGCHVDAQDGCVVFNNNTGTPQGPIAANSKPLCMVKSLITAGSSGGR